MNSSPSNIRSAIENDLIQTINNAIAKSNTFESICDIRIIAIQTLHQIHQAWSTETWQYDGAPREQHEVVDKLHLVYTAAQKLFYHRDLPDAGPAKIIACFTAYTQRSQITIVRGLQEILSGASRVHMSQTKAIGFENMVMAESEKQSKKRKGDLGTLGDDEEETLKESDAAFRPQRKKTKVNAPVSGGTSRAQDAGDVGEELTPKRQAIEDGLSALAVTTPSKSEPAPASCILPRRGPGNFTHGQSTKWYPDEEQFMRNLIVTNPKWTYKQYADANIARFKGTYYTDDDKMQYPGMREGRTANAIRLRLGNFRAGIRKSRPAGEEGGAAYWENDATGPISTGTTQVQEQAEVGGGAAGRRTGGGDDASVTTNFRDQRPELGNMEALAAVVIRVSGKAVSEGGEATWNSTRATGSTEPEAEIMYASGKVVSAGDEGDIETEYDFSEADDGVGVANRSEVGEDENSLEDLEEMVARVEAGAL